MRAIVPILQRHSLWPVYTLIIAAAVLLPSLGRDGLWEPQEIAVADRARALLAADQAADEAAGEAETGDDPDDAASPDSNDTHPSDDPDDQTAEPDDDDPEQDIAGARNVDRPTARPRARPRAKARAKPRTPEPRVPEFTEHAAAVGMDRAGKSELGARLPLALLGVVCVMLAYALGARMASARAGLIAALVLLSFPLFLAQSRQLLSDIGVVCGNAMVALGLVGLAWPQAGTMHWPYGRRLPVAEVWLRTFDALLVLFGAVVSYQAGAALWGLAVPFGAVALGGLATLVGLRHTRQAGRAPDRTSDRTSDRTGGRTSARTDARAGEPPALAPPPPARSPARVAGVGLALLLLGFGLALAVELGDLALSAVWIYAVVLAGLGALIASFAPTRAHEPAPSAPGDADTTRRLGLGHGDTARARRLRLMTVAGAAGVIALSALWLVLSQAFELRDPVPGERALFGYSLIPTGEHVAALGGVWRHADKLDATFDVSFQHIAVGLFPWVGLAPIAIVHLALGARPGRRAFVGHTLLAWALLAWLVSALMARKVTPVPFSALVAVAVAIGIWLDDLISARDQADATAHSDDDARKHYGLPLRQPLVALLALAAAVAIARDIHKFPDDAVSLATLDKPVKFPPGTELLGVPLTVWVIAFGVAFGLCLAGGLWLWTCRRSGLRAAIPGLEPAGRWGIQAAIAVGLAFALFFTHGWLQQLSSRLSSKHVFAVYRDLADSGDQLGILGNYGSGPEYYAGGAFETIRSRPDLIPFLQRDGRVFALTPAGDLCAVHRQLKGVVSYYVLDHGNAKFHLLSNRLDDGERDLNPLARAIVRERPDDAIQFPLSINFDNRVELIGATVPAAVGRGDSFEVTLVFKVLKPVGGSWKVFAHFDAGAARFQGDHVPINNTCNTSYWEPGDYIIDTFTVTAGNVSYPKTTYDLWVGLFQGSFGSWKNMKIVSVGPDPRNIAQRDKDDRVRIARIRVQ